MVRVQEKKKKKRDLVQYRISCNRSNTDYIESLSSIQVYSPAGVCLLLLFLYELSPRRRPSQISIGVLLGGQVQPGYYPPRERCWMLLDLCRCGCRNMR